MKNRGFILVGVLVLVMLCSMIAISLLFRLQADNQATSASKGLEQAWEAAMSGVQEALRVVAASGAGATDWQDSPALFQERFLYEDGSDRWFFTIYSPTTDDALNELRYGLIDEASKIHLNYASTNILTNVEGLTVPLLQALLDFTDLDDVAQPEGAEQEYYNSFAKPYQIKNGPLESLEELLQVKGFTPGILLGEDANYNFRLDPNEDDGEESNPPDNKDGRLDLGFSALFTTSSYEFDDDDKGLPRTNINDPADPLPALELKPAITNYIIALRTNKLTLVHAADLLEDKMKVKDELGREIEIESGVGKEELPQILDIFSTSAKVRIDGLINVNTAPIKVLAAIPGLDQALAESIISARKTISPEKKKSIAWLFEEGVLTTEKFKQAAPYLTARSFQFSFRVVGYGLPSGRFRVLDVIIDVVGNSKTITQVRDLTRFGIPFPLELPLSEQTSMNSVMPVIAKGKPGATRPPNG